jgi:preprotein translocase subunit SecD
MFWRLISREEKNMVAKPIWTYMVIGVLLATALHAWPALSGSEVDVQVKCSGLKGGVDLRLMDQVEVALMNADIAPRRVILDSRGVTVRLSDTSTRDSALGVLTVALGSTCLATAQAVPLVL